MDTRVSMQTIYQNALLSTRQITDQLASLQAQASTGQKFANVSDDPKLKKLCQMKWILFSNQIYRVFL